MKHACLNPISRSGILHDVHHIQRIEPCPIDKLVLIVVLVVEDSVVGLIVDVVVLEIVVEVDSIVELI